MKLLEELKSVKDRKIALQFQRLMIENPYIEDLDVELDIRDDDVIVRVTHSEWYEWEFNASDRFIVRTPENDEIYGNTAEEAYSNALPITIGMRAGYVLKDHDLFSNFTLDIEDDTCVLNMLNRDDNGNDAVFHWSVEEQGFVPVDKDNLPDDGRDICCKTIAEMRDYLDSFER